MPVKCAKMQHIHDKFQWDDLRYILAVARAGSVSGAAQSLNVDHTTVSRRVTRAERLFNAALFDRTRAGYVPTTAGTHVVKLAEQMESALIRCEGEIVNRNDDLSGAVRIAAPDGLASLFLAPRLARLCSYHPSLNVMVYPSQLRYSLAEREVDIGISLQKPDSGRLTARKLIDYRIRLYASRAFLDSYAMPQSFEDLQKVPVVGYISNLGVTPSVDFLPMLPVKISAGFTSSNITAQISAVEAGVGIAFLPDFLTEGRENLLPVPLDFAIDREFWLMIHEDNRNVARVQAVAEFIHNEVRASRDIFKLETHLMREMRTKN